MPIASTDLVFYSVANVPTDDTSASGGAIDTTARVALTQLSAPATPAIQSDGADTRTVTITGRLPTGVVTSESKVLNGASEVVFTTQFERIQRIEVDATSAARTITVKQGAGGATVATITPNEKIRHIQFQNSSSEAAVAVRYEKQFLRNNHASLALLNAQVTLTADPAAKIKMGLGAAVNDTVSVANRKTAPAGVVFVDDGVAQSVPGTHLAAGAACPIWYEQTLAPNDAAAKSTFTTTASGGTIE